MRPLSLLRTGAIGYSGGAEPTEQCCVKRGRWGASSDNFSSGLAECRGAGVLSVLSRTHLGIEIAQQAPRFQSRAEGRQMARASPRRRHAIAPKSTWLLKALGFRYSSTRDAYVLRLVGNRLGPVFQYQPTDNSAVDGVQKPPDR
jgi:hypothetical protein